MSATYLLPSSAVIARHIHADPYATLVLSGGYEEAGDVGRHRVQAGDVLLHGAFSAHRDLTVAGATMVLDIPLSFASVLPGYRGTVSDPDFIVKVAERDPLEAATALFETFCPTGPGEDEPMDRLGSALADDVGIGAWARANSRAREAVSRHFRQVYGVDAARFRLEARARRAWHAIVQTSTSLAEIAVAEGFADQAHMTRAVRMLTTATPAAWRVRSHLFNTVTKDCAIGP
ncbi:AraC family transcriptional regulator [Sphingobium sp. B2D3C]|uniref:AraC family transcriptional regulator n=1 Tax=Sphingobium sp. B2D3C TaxID=2940581 RepID=UPI002223F7B9|nr:AraC family transcriptional regulator [Sphingobium sp. B2D3C]